MDAGREGTGNIGGDEAYDPLRVRSHRILIVFGLGALLAVSAFVATFFGSVGPIGPGTPYMVSFSEAIEAIMGTGNPSNVVIFWEVRIPRVILAGLVGGALACAGTAMQAVFRNSMADPFIIGVSSGAALGASMAGLLGITAAIGAFMAPSLAFVFAMGTVLLVYKMGTVRGRVYVDTLLLSGVAVAAFLGALVSFTIYFAREEYHQLIPWLLGTLMNASWTPVTVISIPIIAGVLTVALYSRGLNALLLGEETAHNLGGNPELLKKIMLGVAALMTAGAVAFTGIIGFVGLIVPHITRLIVGADHRILVPAATLTGAVFLIWADTIARTIIPGQDLPVGVITALCGGPFFLYLLRRSKTGGGSL